MKKMKAEITGDGPWKGKIVHIEKIPEDELLYPDVTIYRFKDGKRWITVYPQWCRLLEDENEPAYVDKHAEPFKGVDEKPKVDEGSLEVYINEYGEIVPKDGKPVTRLKPQTFYIS